MADEWLYVIIGASVGAFAMYRWNYSHIPGLIKQRLRDLKGLRMAEDDLRKEIDKIDETINGENNE